MAFESLADKLQGAFRKLRGKGKVTEADVRAGMREIRLALLEADVNFKVVKDFVAKITERAVGAEVLESLTPGQHIVKIVNEELTALMGGSNAKIAISPKPPTVVMMSGLQGAGKTTTAAKLGGVLKKQGKRPLLVACDVYRPAAAKQLMVVAEKLGLSVFHIEGCKDPVKISTDAIEHAKNHGNDIVIIDTAGRLHIDEQLMDELKNIKEKASVTETLLVVDAMTGQDAVNVAKSFNDQLEVDGVILTKLDGDARGGAALSIRAVTQKPIKYIGTGEKLEDLEPFHPERMANRILGMGDVLSLIEKAEEAIDLKKAEELEKKLRRQEFDLNDFLDQLEQVQKMGPIENMLGMIPGVNAKALQGAQIDERKLLRVGAIIKSMTPAERENPSIINASRKRRIANGSGTLVQDVNALLKQFEQMRQMFKQFGKMSKKGKNKGGRGKFRFPFA
ncbi:MAG: signal recognition particle protein [Eubacteriales bacterium]|jgi:signal recognition particle subunit SRP54|nr:signal recognition particle protein [Eubacteriales bacterium]